MIYNSKYYWMRLCQVIVKIPLFLLAGLFVLPTFIYRGIVFLIMQVDDWWWR